MKEWEFADRLVIIIITIEKSDLLHGAEHILSAFTQFSAVFMITKQQN